MGAWTEIVDYTVPSNTTSVTLDNFGTITKDDFIKVVISYKKNTSDSSNLQLFGNTETTTTNYHTQRLLGTNTLIQANKLNISTLGDAVANGNNTHIGYIKVSENNRFNFFFNNFYETSSNVRVDFYYGTSSGATFTNGIDTLTFTATIANDIGTGSRIQIYRLDAEKVADITVGSNTTQVDISNLSIDKDSEYLLVSDRTGAAVLKIYPNDLTTDTNYWHQWIFGNNTLASAGRGNNASFIGYTGSVNTGIGYTHIKVSEIGAFTAQGYHLNYTTPEGITVWNQFVSSTYENLTSITKLNLKSSVADNIFAGSRFMLYKLK